MKLKRLSSMALLLAIVIIPLQYAFSGDEDVIPPEILKVMNPDILSGKRPIIAFIRQNDIFGLRDNPILNADFVRFDFDPERLSSPQKKILRAWVESGVNRILLLQDDILKYTSIISSASANKKFSSGYTDNVKAANARTAKLLRHPVNTDCSDLGFWYGDTHGHGTGAGVVGIIELPQGSSVIVESNANVPLCGVFPIGKGKVYFYSPPVGSDGRRWQLNFWHWAIGLPVPGSADASTTGISTLTLDEAVKYDKVMLKNGDNISGTILNQQFTILTSYAELKFECAKIEKIVLEGDGTNRDTLFLRVGDKMSGVVKEQTVQIKLLSGQTAQIHKDKIKSIQMRKVETE